MPTHMLFTQCAWAFICEVRCPPKDLQPTVCICSTIMIIINKCLHTCCWHNVPRHSFARCVVYCEDLQDPVVQLCIWSNLFDRIPGRLGMCGSAGRMVACCKCVASVLQYVVVSCMVLHGVATPLVEEIRFWIFRSQDVSVLPIDLLSDGDSIYSTKKVSEILRTPVKTCLICMWTPMKTCTIFWQS